MMLNAKLKKMKERLDHPACQAARRLEAKANELLEAIADVNAFKDGAEDYLMNEHYFEDIETMRRVVELVLSCTTPPRSGDEMLRDFKIKV